MYVYIYIYIHIYIYRRRAPAAPSGRRRLQEEGSGPATAVSANVADPKRGYAVYTCQREREREILNSMYRMYGIVGTYAYRGERESKVI